MQQYTSFLIVILFLLPFTRTYGYALRSPQDAYGAVNFESSCSSEVKAAFNIALSKLYSFWYKEARKEFDDIYASDNDCCIALYFAATSLTHPIWDFISNDRLEETESYSVNASSCISKMKTYPTTAREVAYINALAIYANRSDPALSDPAARLDRYAQSLKGVFYEFDQEDPNAGIIYGLSLLAVGYYSETEPTTGFPNLSLAGLIEESILLSVPSSPGALHYVIHAYDQPALASRALSAAYSYLNASIAVPHALHMPSHIFSDLGLWQDMVSSNVLSLNTAYSESQDTTGDWYHGAYFLEFGMLELAMDCDARGLLDTFQNTLSVSVFDGNLEAALRVPVHYYVETRDWAGAAAFNLSTFYDSVPGTVWQQNQWTLVYEYFLATVGKAVIGRSIQEISLSCSSLRAAGSALQNDPSWTTYQLPYWRKQFETMVKVTV
jgi:hypothetical protein